MARYVKLSTVAPEPPRFHTGPPAEAVGQSAVDRMISFWRNQLAQVLPERPDLILVPEACDRYGDHSPKEQTDYYRIRGDQLRDYFAKTAKENRCYIAYAAVRQLEDGTWRNSVQLIDRKGEIAGVYNKNHLVIEETTEGGILCGKDAPVFACDFGRVACAICFDLNFDELRLKYAAAKPDLLLFASMYHGGLMQSYWAYACRAHFLSAISGERSVVLSPQGETLAHTTNYFDHVTATVNLDCRLAHLDYNWGRLAAMREKYGAKVRVYDPGYLGSVLVSSESNEFSVDDVLREFEIELLDDYFVRALAHHHDPKNIEP